MNQSELFIYFYLWKIFTFFGWASPGPVANRAAPPLGGPELLDSGLFSDKTFQIGCLD